MTIKRLFLDLETTGLNAKINGIHQISGFIEIDNVIRETFDFKLKPFEGAIIESEALEAGNVTEEEIFNYDLTEFDVYSQLINIFSKYIKKFDKKDKCTLIGYNVHFDKDFLSEMWKRQKDDYLFSFIWGNHIDVMVLATEHLETKRPQLENFKLISVAKFLGLNIDEEKLHNSLYDIQITRDIFYLLRPINIIPEQEIKKSIDINSFLGNTKTKSISATKDLSNVKSLRKINDLNYVMEFGKYSGFTFRQILTENPKYIRWLHDNTINGIVVSTEILDMVFDKE